MADKIKVEILPDGSIKMETDTISLANHVSIEGFVSELTIAAGGLEERLPKSGTIGHHHGDYYHEH